MSNHLSTVKSIGAGIRKCESAAAEIATAITDAGLDFTARGVVTEAVHVWAMDGSTDERPAVKSGSKGDQRATDYGRGVDALTKVIKRLLATDDVKAPTLRVSLSGEGGGSTVVPADHPLYGALVALLAGDNEE